jgi:hypothetical protein
MFIREFAFNDSIEVNQKTKFCTFIQAHFYTDDESVTPFAVVEYCYEAQERRVHLSPIAYPTSHSREEVTAIIDSFDSTVLVRELTHQLVQSYVDHFSDQFRVFEQVDFMCLKTLKVNTMSEFFHSDIDEPTQ